MLSGLKLEVSSFLPKKWTIILPVIFLVAKLTTVCRGQEVPTVVNPIDAVLAEFELRHPELNLPGATSDVRFARRAYLDLTGYPPSPEQLRDFIALADVNKDRELVHNLLHSERYGWKWGRWLALQSGASENDLMYAAGEMGTRPEDLFLSWVQWMVKRVSEDTPYDQIVEGCVVSTSREGRSLRSLQAELDRIAEASPLDVTVYQARETNDLYWRRTPLVTEPAVRAEDVAERFLGLSVKCARCHDHPLLPFTQDEHQQFTAVFHQMVYSEQPLTHTEKRLLLTGGLLGTLLACAAIATFLKWLPQAGRRISWLCFLTGAGVGTALFAACNYLHLLPGVEIPYRTSPGLLLVRVALRFCNQPDARWCVLSVFSLLALPVTVVSFFCRRVLTSLPKRVLNDGLLAFFVLTGVDLVYLGTQHLDRSPSDSAEGLLHNLQREVFRTIGLGGCGQQPREIFVREEQTADIAEPKLLKGPRLLDVTDQQPDRRTMLVNWLRCSDVPFLSEHLVNMIWQEYFSQPLLSEGERLMPDRSDLNRESPLALRAKLMSCLNESFRKDQWSLRSLHEVITTSRLYRMAGDLETAANNSDWPRWLSGFPARRLTAEQFLASIEQVTQRPIPLGEAYGWSGASPFQTASTYPWSSDLGGIVMRSWFNRPFDGTFAMETAMMNLVEPELVTHIRENDGWVAAQCRNQVPPEDFLRHAFERCFGRTPLPSEIENTLTKWLPEQSWADFAADVVWAMMNSAEFQYVL